MTSASKIGLLVTILVAPQASAAPFLEIVDPGLVGEAWIERVEALDPANPASLEDTAALDFVKLTSRGMAEQSFSLQHLTTDQTAIAPGATGTQFGVQLTTFPLTPPPENLVGKEENTQFIPVLPRLQVAYAGAKDDTTWGLGFSFVPPLSVQGASALVFGTNFSIGQRVHEKVLAGVEIDASFGQALAPVVATKAQYEAGELPNIPEDRYEAVCAPQEFGCIDTLTFAHLVPKAVAVIDISDTVQPYVKVGAQYLHETFHVQVDLSTWRLKGWLPFAGVGVNLNVHENLRVGAALSTAMHDANLSDLGAGVFYRFDGGISYSFGQ